MSNILQTIESFIGPYITQALDLLNGLSVWIQGAILLAVGIFAIVGVFVFLKKFIKLFVVLAILGGIFYVVWTQTTVIQDLLGLTGYVGTQLSIF